MSHQQKPKYPAVIGNYALGRMLGSGYSGSIFEATHIHNGQVVALKIQDVDHECPTNNYERYLYPLLMGGKGMPTLWASGVQGEWDYLALDLLGSSLDGYYKSNGGPNTPFDLGTTCAIAMQLISRLETMHTRGVLHRDIQLGNSVVGRGTDQRLLYMIDFGFSKRYIDPHTKRHIPDSKAKLPSRRDDLEAVALLLIHVLTPRGLAWTRDGVPKTDAAHDILKGKKRRARPEDLCRHLPDEFEEFLRYSRSLKFAEQPDYTLWIETFRDLKEEAGYGDSDDFIWPPPKPVEKPHSAYATRVIRGSAVEPDVMEGILNDLTRMKFDGPGERQVFGDQTNVVEKALRRARDDESAASKDVIDISDGSEIGESKATRLAKLTTLISSAADNATLSGLVGQFIEAMKCNSSRAMTKDANRFLEALQKQLEDPSVFLVPARASRQLRSDVRSDDKEPAHVKAGVVARLRLQVGSARNNKDLASMLGEFIKVTNKSTGRTITKDGFYFFDGLSRRLKALQ
ncbi:hypothetical protein H0H92_015185 [Tricholoma furcatifolium]|nr:hypothetical protein H0H92_015185 [Tricholoma furcatifolium]